MASHCSGLASKQRPSLPTNDTARDVGSGLIGGDSVALDACRLAAAVAGYEEHTLPGPENSPKDVCDVVGMHLSLEVRLLTWLGARYTALVLDQGTVQTYLTCKHHSLPPPSCLRIILPTSL